MYLSTAPSSGDEQADSARKINQVLASGPSGSASTMYADTNPTAGDEIGDSFRKINQLIHNNGGI